MISPRRTHLRRAFDDKVGDIAARQTCAHREARRSRTDYQCICVRCCHNAKGKRQYAVSVSGSKALAQTVPIVAPYAPAMWEQLKQMAKRVDLQIRVCRAVLRDVRTPWLAKGLLALAIVYFVLPIDVIPDFIPVIGHLDDVVIVPGLILLAFYLVPRDVVSAARKQVFPADA